MEVTEVLKILSTLSDTDLSKVKDYLNSLITDTNSFRSFFSQKKFENGVFCPHCNSINVKKNGHKGIIQRFLCKDCGKSFTSRNNTITFSSKKSYPIWKKYIECMMNCERIFNEAKRLENISKTIKARFTETLVDAKIEDLDNFLNEHPLEKQILNTSAKDLKIQTINISQIVCLGKIIQTKHYMD